MALNLDASQSFQVIVNTETVQYYVRNTHGQFVAPAGGAAFAAPVPVSSVKRWRVNKRDLDQSELLTVKDVAFTFWRRPLEQAVGHAQGTGIDVVAPEDEIIPKKGDVILDAVGNYFVIDSVEIIVWGEQFRCPTKLYLPTEAGGTE